MAIDADILVRAGGSGFFAIVGIAALLFARGNRGAQALGLFLTTLGIGLVGQNLLGGDAEAGRWWTPIYTVLLIVREIGMVGLVFLWPRPLRPRDPLFWPAVAMIAAFFVVYLGFLGGFDAARGVPTPYPVVAAADVVLLSLQVGLASALTLLLPLRYARTAPEEGLLRRKLAWATVLVVSLAAGRDLLRGAQFFGSLLPVGLHTTLLVFVAAGLWLWATRVPDSRPARNAALALLAAMLVGTIEQAIAPEPSALINVTAGVVRTLSAFIIAYAILRVEFLGYAPTLRTARRGTIAAGSLALLFIVAQIAQNFLSASYGLVMGGIVAGAFLFAAQPLQRAMERLQAPAPGTTTQVAGAESIFRETLRMALKDQRVTAEEEQHLAELGERLGISARRVVAIRQEIERENGVR